jgi:tetratricopeptide (TPR) repeat protein
MRSSSDHEARIPGALAVQQARDSANAGQWASALIAYDQALSVHQAWELDPDFLNDRAVALFHNQRMEDGLKLLDAAIAQQPHYGYRYAARGWMRQAMKDIPGAISDYEKAIELDPEDAITLNNLGLLEEQLGRMKSAKERFRMADELDRVLEEREIPKSPPNANSKTERSSIPTVTKSKGVWSEIWHALFTSKGRKEFLDFLRNGFKLNG